MKYAIKRKCSIDFEEKSGILKIWYDRIPQRGLKIHIPDLPVDTNDLPLEKERSIHMKRRLIRTLSNLFALMAIVFAAAPCNGKFHEPEMPEELRK